MFSTPMAPEVLHTPDGFFSVAVSLVGWGLTCFMVALALRNTRDQLGERQIPLMGIIAAAIFAGQMLNFTIPGGTSGHLLGGTLAAIVIGPWAGVLVMTSVIAVQALIFQDGGLLVMGLNILNMGILTSFSGYFIYRVIRRFLKGRPGLVAAAFAGGWVSLLVSAASVAVELAISGTSPLQWALPVMVGVHAIIGIGEGLLTVFALLFILAARPDFITGEKAPGQRSARWVLAGLAIALGLTLLAPFASPYSDGLERVADILYAPENVDEIPVGVTELPESQQFSGEWLDAPFKLLAGYSIPFLGDSGGSTILAGMIGVVVVFVIAYIAASLTRRRSPDSDEDTRVEN